MATEIWVPNDIYSPGGWFGFTAWVDEGIANTPDGNAMDGEENDAIEFYLRVLGGGASVIVDADTVTNVTVRTHARSTGGGSGDRLDLNLIIDNQSQGSVNGATLTTTFATDAKTNAGLWDSDWTAAQLDGMRIECTAVQSGMPTSSIWYLEAVEVEVEYTEAAGGIAVPVVHHHHSLMR